MKWITKENRDKILKLYANKENISKHRHGSDYLCLSSMSKNIVLLTLANDVWFTELSKNRGFEKPGFGWGGAESTDKKSIPRAKEEKIRLPVAVSGSKTSVLKPSSIFIE